MSRYQINKTDVKYAEEFRNNLYLNNYYYRVFIILSLNINIIYFVKFYFYSYYDK